MKLAARLRSLLQYPWFISILLLAVFMSVNGYKYGWDDQHLEIPLLKSLIDDTLYRGDYYVESLKKNFSSFLYPILAHIISINQIPSVYFILYILSRYFFFYWIYKLWLVITKHRWKAFACTLTFMYILRVSEFLYRTFSHQELGLALIFAGIYFFYKERFILASVILGISTNIHALYSLFPMFYITVFLLLQIKKHGFQTLLKSTAAFLVCCAPFLIWSYQKHLTAYIHPDPTMELQWLNVYRVSCGQNFILPLLPFKTLISHPANFFNATQSFLVLIILYILNISFNKEFRQNPKTQAFCIGAFILLAVCVLFTYTYPTRFFVDLNLKRNEQFLLFLLGGYTLLLLMNRIESEKPVMGFILAICFTLLKFGKTIMIPASGIILFSLAANQCLKNPRRFFHYVFFFLSLAAMVPCMIGIYRSFHIIPHRLVVMTNLTLLWGSFIIIVLFLLGKKMPEAAQLKIKRLFYIIPLVVFFLQYSYYHYERHHIEKTEGGFWQLQRDWMDMANFVKYNTPKDAVIFTPYDLDMDNFRIFSERQIVVSERDKGIVGFDYFAAVESRKRKEDVKSYTIALKSNPRGAVQNAILKYKADYIVFMRYAMPKTEGGLVDKVYTNTTMSLFRVLPNPIIDKIQSMNIK